ncbi:MAG: hypothetical protein KDC18_04985 [Alphaproteobacteria bacterium]|nr:hypothetical protein [Alphaproteobacteria bacterium]MCB9930775.1 hypothetical protein [Alphaproteobacteria bacterium]
MTVSRIARWGFGLLLVAIAQAGALGAAAAPPPPAQPPFGVVLIIDAGLYQGAPSAAVAGMFGDIRRMAREAGNAEIAIIASNRGRTLLLLPNSQERLNLTGYIRSELRLDQRTGPASPAMNLNAIRAEIRTLIARWRLGDPVDRTRARRRVLVRVFGLKWYLDGMSSPFADLYAFEYPNSCLGDYLWTYSGWPDTADLDLEFRPPSGFVSPPPGAFTGFVIALTGKPLPGPNIVYRGWAGPECETGAPIPVPEIAFDDPERPVCSVGMRTAPAGETVQACIAAPALPAVAANLVPRPINIVTADGGILATSVALAAPGSTSHRARVKADGIPLTPGAPPRPFGAGVGSSVRIETQVEPTAGCRPGQPLQLTVQGFGPSRNDPPQDRTLAVADMPCIAVALPMGEIRVR